MSAPTADRTSEIRALTELAFSEVAGATAGIHRTHRAVSDRVFSAVGLFTGTAAAPVKVVHDAITDGVYRVVADTTAISGVVGGRVADLPMRSAPSKTVRGSGVIAAVNGLIGDRLAESDSVLAAEPMSLRVDGHAVPAESAAITGAYPFATGRIAIFLHGLAETEHAWRHHDDVTYGGLLAATLDVTPVYVRYNTGRHISENGTTLSSLIDRLVAQWPVEVTDISLIGHSMGGLVARSALHSAQSDNTSWAGLVHTTVSLGTPHLGAPLEALAHRASAGLLKFPETAPFGRLLRRRSGGIRDLRGGSIVDEDWRGRDPDALGEAIAAEVPLHPGADHYFVSATLTRSPNHIVAKVLGDGLVLHRSAGGWTEKRRIGFDPRNGMHLAGANHFTLLNHPAVGERIIDWLS